MNCWCYNVAPTRHERTTYPHNRGIAYDLNKGTRRNKGGQKNIAADVALFYVASNVTILQSQRLALSTFYFNASYSATWNRLFVSVVRSDNLSRLTHWE
jgi:hypothetical protein